MTSAPTPREVATRIPELDGLRGLAILLVILCHYVGNARHAPLGFWPHRFLSAFAAGWSGVDLFFVLSGFLIGGILLNAREAPNYFRAFYMRRVFRILPVYYLWTLLFAIAVAVTLAFFPGRLEVSGRDLLRVPVQLSFVQNMFADMPRFSWIWFNVTWSLAVEEQFYILAPPLIRFLTTRNLVIVLGATICAAPVLRILVFEYLKEGNYLAVFAMPCRADALAWGMLLAAGWRKAWFRELVNRSAARLRVALTILFLGAGALLWWLVHPINEVTVTIGFSWLAILYSALLLRVISNPQGRIAGVMRWKILGWLGGISYCVYILHDAFNFFAHQMFLHAEPQIYTAKGVGVTLFALAATLVVASLSWRYFEKPLIRRGHTYSYGEGRAA
jgi:peptidoglycan/LPS O-acetylase OafA/YrhL